MELKLTDDELTDLLLVLNIALLDAQKDTQRTNIRAWIHRLTQLSPAAHYTEEELRRAREIMETDSTDSTEIVMRRPEPQSKPRRDIEAADAEEQARQDWSNDE